MLPVLTDAEVAEVCAPLSQPAAQARYLERLGVSVRRKPNGHLLVGRAEFERAMGLRGADIDTPTSAQPDHAALAEFMNRGKHGAQAKRQ